MVCTEDPCNCCSLSPLAPENVSSWRQKSLFPRFFPRFSSHPSALFSCLSFRQNTTETKLEAEFVTLAWNVLFLRQERAQRPAPKSLTPPQPPQLQRCLQASYRWWLGNWAFWLAQLKPSSFISSPTIGCQSTRRGKRLAWRCGRCLGWSCH